MNPFDNGWSLRLGEPLGSGIGGHVLAAVLLAIPVALALWQARANRRHTSALATAGLLLVRLAVIALVWAAATLEPSLVHRRVDDVPGRVLIAVDVSSSMDATDPQRPLDEKLRLAGALDLAAANDVRRWLADVEAGGSAPEAAMVSERIDRLTRREAAVRLLASGGWLERLQAERPTSLDAFAEREWKDVSASALPSPPTDAVWETDLGVPLRRSLALSADTTATTLGIVILSDGRQSKGPLPTAVARDLKAAGVPVFAIALGSRRPPRDVAVIDVAVPSTVRRDAETHVEAKVRIRNLPAQEIDVELWDASPTPKRLGQKTLSHPGGDGTLAVRFPAKFDDVGVKRLEVKASPKGGDAEVSTANNASAAIVRVDDDKLRVLLVDDQLGWEAHYRAMALVRDPDLKVDRITLDPPRLKTLTADEREKASLPADRWPDLDADKDDPLWGYRVIVLGDVSKERLPDAVRDRLERYVADGEGSLIIAGQSVSAAPLGGLSPVKRTRVLPAKKGTRTTPTDEGWRLPFFALDDEDAESRKRWADVPESFGGLAGVPRPGAKALAIRSGAESGEAVIAMGHVGLGRVLWIGLGDTWRWRFKVGDRDHQRFWGQLVRWAASESSGSEPRGVPSFGAKKPAYAAGQPVEIFLNRGPKGDAAVGYRIVRDGDKTVQSSGRLEKTDRPRAMHANVGPLPPGSYRIEVDAAATPHAQRDRFTVLPPESGELADLAPAVDMLRTIADESGGRLLWPEEIGQLPELLRKQATTREEIVERRLTRDTPWTWWLLGIAAGLLTIEWIARKRSGMA